MRILLLNWPKIWHGAHRGGGINGYTQSLARILSAQHHQVLSLCGGTRRGPGMGGRCHIRRHADWESVRVFELVNSPCRAPSALQFDDPGPEASSPELEAVLADFAAIARPDLVHIQSLEGFSAGCIESFRRAGARVVFSLHNYHTVCPQVYLMQGGAIPCRDFQSGHACVGCLTRFGPPTPRRSEDSPAIPVTIEGAADRVTIPVRAPDDALGPMPPAGSDQRATPEGPAFDPPPEARAPLDNTPTPEPQSDRSPNAYAHRRNAMIDALNACDAVLAVSDFVAHKFIALGVRADRVRRLTIGTRMTERAADEPHAIAPPTPFTEAPARPIRLVFIGHHNPYKGLPMLLDSLEACAPATLARLHLSVFAQHAEPIEHRLRRLAPRLARLDFAPGYRYDDIPWIVGGADLGVVCSTWWDNAPQTVMEFLACGVPVLGAEAGGIPDFIRHGENGLLFRANDRTALAATLDQLAADPAPLDQLRAGVRPPKSLAEHAREILDLYRELLGSADATRRPDYPPHPG
ncbi:MAG: glycosyltransferase [Phycisphaerales bacterium JB037]